MKIALIHHQYQKKGGMERYLFDLIEGFGARDDTVDLYVYKQESSLAIPKHCQVFRKNINWIPRRLRKYFFSGYLNHTFDPSQYDISLSMMRSTCQDISVSGGTHRGFLDHLSKRPSIFDKIEIEAERRSFESAKKVIAHSKLISAEIQNYYHISPEKIICLLPPINTKKFNQSAAIRKEDINKKYHLDSGKIKLLFPSTGHKRKGLDELLMAMKLLPESDFELLIAGSKVETPIKNIRSLGFVDDMPALYAAVDFTILPSHYEPFGLVIPESIACGTPVLISSFVGAKEVVTESDGMTFPDLSPEAIAATIKKASTHPFNISKDYATHHHLTLEQHINQIRTIL